MKQKFSTPFILSTILFTIGILATSFVALPGNKTTRQLKASLKDQKVIVNDGCEDIVYGYYTISGGSSNPSTHHPWNDCSGGYAIQGLDPRTIQVYPGFGGGGTYTFTKLSSNPSTISLSSLGSSCYFTLNNWGDVITIQVSKGGVQHVVSFYFTP